jgi:hypothetical protein
MPVDEHGPSAVTDAGHGRTLWLVPAPQGATGDDVVVVLDAAWTPQLDGDPCVVSMRDAADRVLRTHDAIEATSELLDRWAVESGIVERLTIQGTSFWYYARLRHWLWLQERVLWTWVLRQLLETWHPATVVCAAGADEALLDVVRLMTDADGLAVRIEGVAQPTGGPVTRAAAMAATPAPTSRARPSFARRVVRRLRAIGTRGGRAGATAAKPSMAFMRTRLARLEAEKEPRLLVVLNHHPQRIETPAGSRVMNAYLGPVADRLRGSRLEPITLDIRAKRADPPSLARVTGPGAERALPGDVLRVDEEPVDPAVLEGAADVARSIESIRVPVVTSGIDLGPDLARNVGSTAAMWLPGKHRAIAQMRRLIERLPVAGVLIADEYHRQDWMAAATACGVRIAAIQHGLIYRRHNGYIHKDRPPQLHLVDRTYVFGRWERDLLVEDSVYRADEVRVGGSPRLDLRRPPNAVDREAVRAELGVAPGDRLVVLSGTHGVIYRRFHYPVALARLFDRPIPGVHLVVKLHPAEKDEGPYRAVIEGVATARGFAPPPISVVQAVDLYRLLGAADAHLGIHSTVLTEAVFVGTPNLFASGLQGGDLLGYLPAGVALPVVDGADLLTALDRAAAGAITAEAREAFIAQHFEPGSASDRIADDLLAWLA